jgi:hypothetical protein
MIRLLTIIFISMTLFSCTQQKKIKKASNKVFELTERYPSLIQNKDTTINLNYKLDGVILENNYNIPNNKLRYNEVYNIIDSINIINILKTDSNINIDIKTDCPPLEIDTFFRIEYQTIEAESNCKSEVRERTKYLKRTNWLLVIIVMTFFINNIRKIFM